VEITNAVALIGGVFSSATRKKLTTLDLPIKVINHGVANAVLNMLTINFCGKCNRPLRYLFKYECYPCKYQNKCIAISLKIRAFLDRKENEIKTKNCSLCGNEFNGMSQRKFCSLDCIHKTKKEYMRNYMRKRTRLSTVTNKTKGL
jgi:hypothetical protein